MLSLVVITILNDGTMITIAYDKVIPEKTPQKWALGEVVVISSVLGAVACVSSMLLLVFALQTSYGSTASAGFLGHVFGSNPDGESAKYLLYHEVETVMYLKISISDFLTLFSARTRSWFTERRPGYALAVALLVATGSSTLFSVQWDAMFGQGHDYTYMVGLHGYSCLAVWVYCILWFFVQVRARGVRAHAVCACVSVCVCLRCVRACLCVCVYVCRGVLRLTRVMRRGFQDVVKLGTYYMLEKLSPDAARIAAVHAARVTTQLVTDELRMDRTAGGGSHEAPTRSASTLRLRASTVTADVPGGALALARIDRLEAELRRMAADMDVMRAHIAELRGGGGGGGAPHSS